MEKIKSFLSKWLDDEFWGAFISLVLVVVISVCVQSFLFWADDLPFVSNFRVGTLSFGMIADIILFAAILVFALWTNKGPDTFMFLGTMVKGRICLFFITLATIAAYVSVVFVFQWWVVLSAIAVIFICEHALLRLKADDSRINLAFGVALIYCVGTYIALFLNDLMPAISPYGAFAIAVISLIMFFKPALE